VSRGLGWAREIVAIVGVGLVGIASFVFLVVADSQFVVRVYERSESSTLPVVVAGAVAAVGTVLGVVWYRRRVGRLGSGMRRFLGWVGIAWSVLFVVAFIWTHPVSRDAELAVPVHAGVVTYLLLIVVAAMACLPVAVLRLSRPKPHRPDDRIRVWRVRDKKPFFVSYCDCGWVGAAYDADEPRARDNAFRDARRHGTNVASDVEDPLG
jgi:hypothetical protein